MSFSGPCKLGRPGTTLSTILWFYLMICSRACIRSKAAHSTEIPPCYSVRDDDRESICVLSAPCLGDAQEGLGSFASLSPAQGGAERCARRRPDRWTYSDIATDTSSIGMRFATRPSAAGCFVAKTA